MAIGKMLKLGGLENSAPNTSQTPNRFKVAKNVTISKDNHITPRPSMEGFTTNTGHDPSYPVTRWTHFTTYTDFVSKTQKLLRFGFEDQAGYEFKFLFDDTGIIPSYDALDYPTWNYGDPYPNNFTDQSIEYQGCKYFLSNPNTSFSKLVRYDGFEANPAGSDSPWFVPTTSITSTTYTPEPNGTRFIKLVGHYMDMQGNVVNSDTVSYRTSVGEYVSGGTTYSDSYSGFNNVASGVDQYGVPMSVAVGGNTIAFSYDGINWDSNVRLSGTYFPGYSSETPRFICVCQGSPAAGNLWVAIGDQASYPVYLSEDGLNWRRSQHSSLASIGAGWQSIVWGEGKFVAVRTGGTTANSIMTSADGITWTYRTAPAAITWKCVSYNPYGTTVKFVAVGWGTTANSIMTSADGITWVSRTAPAATSWTSVVWGGSTASGAWAAVASFGTTTTAVMTSTDGITWAARTSPFATEFVSIAWAPYSAGMISPPSYGVYIAVARGSTTSNCIMYSFNGTTWSTLTSPNVNGTTSVDFFPSINSINGVFNIVSAGTGLYPTSTLKKITYITWDGFSLGTATEISSPTPTVINLSEGSASILSFLTSSGNSPDAPNSVSSQQCHFYGKAVYNSLTDEFDLTTSDTTGTWGRKNFGTWGDLYLIRTIKFTYNFTTYTAIAYKSKPSYDKFYGDIKIYNPRTLTWEDVNGSAITKASGLFAASRTHYTVWASPLENGVYYYKGSVVGGDVSTGGIYPKQKYLVDVNTTNIENQVQKASDLPFQISGSLQGWYDITSTKVNFNSLVTTSNPDPFVAMTIYQEGMILATQNIIYFSDPSLGSSFEMTSGLSAIVIGDSEKGRITAVCGTKDFLIVSRERKVYMVAGTLGTANLRVQEIPGIGAGAYSNSCLQEVDGNVILLSSAGCWWINAANSKKLSEQIELNFKTFLKRYITQQPSVELDNVIFDMNTYPVNAYSEATSGKYVTAAYDSYRNILIFTDNSTAKCGESLVLHLNNNEWTNWESYDADALQHTAMAFLDGRMCNGTLVTTTKEARTSREDQSTSVYTYDYTSRSAPKLITTWMTAGEPSLEKQVLQLKLFGYIWSDLAIKHYQNWDLNTAVTNTTYTSPGSTSPSNYIMFHKQRLNSSKAMAVAIEIGMKSGGKTFWIEGIEVEFEAIQAGMKR